MRQKEGNAVDHRNHSIQLVWCVQARIKLAALTLLMAAALSHSGVASADEYYIRGGLGLDRINKASFTDVDCNGVPHFYGCGTRDGLPRQSMGKFGTVTTLEFGAGYNITGPIRFEAVIDYRPRFTFNGHANFLAPNRRQDISASGSSASLMLAGFVDIPLPERFSNFTPFIGAGIGTVWNRIGKSTLNFPATIVTLPGGSLSGMTHMLTLGVAVPLNERTTLDLSYRYSDLGKIQTGRGEGSTVWRDGRKEPSRYPVGPTQSRLKAEGIRLSLRYTF